MANPVFSQGKAESLRYEILVLGLKIGELVAEKTPEINNSQVYKVESFVKFWFFGNVDLRFSTVSQFLHDEIVRTKSESKTNRGDFLSTVQWNGRHYEVDANTYKYENQKPVNGPLTWCSTKLFFHEPKHEDVFLSEVYGVSQKITQIQPGVYEIKIDGNANRYFYKSGILEKIVLENPIKNYQIRRIR
ncbi:DUF6134 family protein [Algoriphagus mannitolivorans]|uniref:DUF6134 family protein n=1 Tax=Algoriphagus mannitolivorans TaxID=226504 RepID=UPI000685F68F|nr:DUF6134 family protein [Algoriphagus mannitolivorans]